MTSLSQTTPTTTEDLSRNAVIARIRTALRQRSGKAWSVTGGRGTAYGWITIDAPPARRTWHTRDSGQRDHAGYPVYEESDDPSRAFGHASPADRAELATLLGLERAHHQGVSIPSGNDYRREYLDRAEGRAPRVHGTPYWD